MRRVSMHLRHIKYYCAYIMPFLYNGNVLTPLPPQEEELGVSVRPAPGGGAAAVT
jgi:hypothetical protein